MSERNTSVSSRFHGRNHFDDGSSSSEDVVADLQRESHAETRSASFLRNKSTRDKMRALMSRSLDGTSRASSSAKGSAAEIGTGRPLARRRRTSPHTPSDRASSGGSRDRRPTTTVHDSVTSSPVLRRYSDNHTAPRRPEDVHRLRRPRQDVSPTYLIRAPAMASGSRGVGTGGRSSQPRASSSILSQRKTTNRADRSQPRLTPSVRFSSLGEERTPIRKRRSVANMAPRRSTTAASKTGFSSDQFDPADDSSSSSIADPEPQTSRRRVKRSRSSADLTSRSRSATRSRSKGFATRSTSTRKSGPGGGGSTTKDEPSRSRQTLRRHSTSSDTSSGSESSATFSTSESSSSSVEESKRDVGAVAGRMPQTSKTRGRRTVGSQTLDSSTTTHRISTSRGSQTNLPKPVKRVASRPHSSRHSSSRAASTVSSPRAVQTHKQDNRRPGGMAVSTDAPGKVSRSTSPLMIAERGTKCSAAVPAAHSSSQTLGAVSMTTPKSQEDAQGISAHRILSKTPDTQRSEDKDAAVLGTLPREEEDTGSSSTAASSDKDVDTECPRAGLRTLLANSRAPAEDTGGVGAESSDATAIRYQRTVSELPLVEGEGGPLEPTCERRPADDAVDTQGDRALNSKRSFTDVVQVTLSDSVGHAVAEPGMMAGPDTSAAGELEPCSSSYLGGNIVIPPSMPVEDSPRQRLKPRFEDVRVPGTESQPQPPQEWPVIADGRRDTPSEAAVRSPRRSRFWQPWSLCSAAGVMMLVPLAFALAPMLGSGPGDGKGPPGGPRSAHNDTSAGDRDVSAKRALSLQDLYVEDADVADSCNGTAPKKLENTSALSEGGPYRAPYKPDADLKPQFRPVFCVFDTEYLHPKRPYTPLQIPTSFCSTIIFYGLSFSRFNAAVDSSGAGGFRRPLDAEFFENISASRFYGRLQHRGRRIPFYVTFGGRRSDSAEFVRMLRDPTWRKATVEGIVNDTTLSERPKYDGVNLDWNHPGDNCDVLKHPQLFHVLVESLGSGRMKVMLTVPPLPRYAAQYDLEPLLESVVHVVVATHKLRPRGSVDCSGGRLYAAQAFREIRDAYSAAYRRKFAYSMAVGGDTFVTATVALGAAILPSPAPPSGLVLRPNKTSFESVCNVAPLFVNPDDTECVMVITQVLNSADAGKLYHVAAYAGPKQIRERMHRSYADDMGDAPVVVFDAHLDDFAGTCPGDSPRMSPQIAAIAEGTRRDLE